jgi:hypothetical protein
MVNSHATRYPLQQRFSTYVWAGIVDDYLTGLSMISNRLHGFQYDDFLK